MSSATVDPAEIRDPRGDELANLLDWQDMVGAAPGILSTKTGRLQATYRVQCPDTAQMAPEARAWYLARLDAVLRLWNRVGPRRGLVAWPDTATP
jgi:hypothetical protein